MSAIVCPQCHEVGLTWYMGEEEPPLTQWWCAVCGYTAQEDERQEGVCPQCSSNSLSVLQDAEHTYSYCMICHYGGMDGKKGDRLTREEKQ